MKSNKIKLAAILAIAGFMACGNITRADDTTPAPADASGAPAKAPKAKGPKGGPLMEALQKLNLSDEQKEKIKPIMKEQRTKMEALNQEGNLTREEKMPKVKAIMDETKEQLKAILTPEQFAKFEAETKNMRPGVRRPKADGEPGSAATRGPKGPDANADK